MNVLCLVLFCTEPKKSEVQPIRALRRAKWASEQIELALRKPESIPGKNLHECGYVSIVLIGPDSNVHHVERFDTGYTAVIVPNGNAVEVTDKQPEINANSALGYLDIIRRYCAWAEMTEHAMLVGERPPLLEGPLNRPELHQWVGTAAYSYFEAWKAGVFTRSAAKSEKAEESFEEQLLENVQHLTERTSVAPSGHEG